MQKMYSIESITDVATAHHEEEDSFEWPVPEKVVSMPVEALQSKQKLKEKKSAPSYLNSLADNDGPSFRKPGKEPRPAILTGSIVTEEDVVNMIAAHESDPENGLKKYLSSLLKAYIVRKICVGIEE